MRLHVAPENLVERLVMSLGIAPVTLMDTHMAFMRARAIMLGARLGVFDAVSEGAGSPAAVANVCGTDPPATEKLLNALVGSGYLEFAHGQYRLAPVARRWVVSTSSHSLRDAGLVPHSQSRSGRCPAAR